MRRLPLILFAASMASAAYTQSLPFPGPGSKPSAAGVTLSLAHSTVKSDCASGSTTCAVTVPSTTAGNLLVYYLVAYRNGSTMTMSAPTGEATATHCPASLADNNFSGNEHIVSDCHYVLSATGGVTSITFGVNIAPSAAWLVRVLELHRTSGTWSYDTGGVTTPASCSTTCTGVALTLATTPEVIATVAGCVNSVISPVTSPYDTNSDFSAGVGSSVAVNPANGNAPTWKQDVSGSFQASAGAWK